MTGLRVDVLTLFPGAFTGPLDVSMLRRARESGLLDLAIHDIRDYARDRHRTVDDYPFGGGQGMVLRVDVLVSALESVRAMHDQRPTVVYLTPQGRRLDDHLVRVLARKPRLALICGRYEGVDERFVEHCVDEQVSIGDFVLTGGELPAMVLIDAVARHVPGVLGDEQSPHDESFADGLLEYPHYTRPAGFRGWHVPQVLLDGNHADIERWRREQRVERTRQRRPDLLPPAASAPHELEKIGVAGVRVRAVRYPGDLPAVLELWRRAPEGDPGRLETPVQLAGQLDRNPQLSLVAEARGDVVGAILGTFDGLNGYVHRLAVVPAWQGKGVDSGLVRVLEGRLRDLGCSRVIAIVPDANGSAFWQAQDWKQLGAQVWEREIT